MSRRARGIRSAGSKGTRLEPLSGPGIGGREGLGAELVVLDAVDIVTSDGPIVGDIVEDEEAISPLSDVDVVVGIEETMTLESVEAKVVRARFDVAGIGMTIVGIGSVSDSTVILSPTPVFDSVEGAVDITGELRPP